MSQRGRYQQGAVARAVVAGDAEHAPLAAGRGRADGGRTPERVADVEARDAHERADGHLERHEQPVHAVEQREPGQQHAAEVLGLGLDRAEVHARVLELPQARRRHARIGDCGWHDGERPEPRATGRRVRGHPRSRERVPVQPPVGVLVGFERDAVRRARPERVLEAIRHPRHTAA
jgi:hypothetical protein